MKSSKAYYTYLPDQVDGGADKWQQSSDGRRLVELLEKLRECKDDEQQRSWALHEDEHTITTHLSDLLDLLVSSEESDLSRWKIKC